MASILYVPSMALILPVNEIDIDTGVGIYQKFNGKIKYIKKRYLLQVPFLL